MAFNVAYSSIPVTTAGAHTPITQARPLFLLFFEHPFEQGAAEIALSGIRQDHDHGLVPELLFAGQA